MNDSPAPPPRSWLGKLVRFGVVGLSNSLVFAIVTALLINQFNVGSKTAAVLGYAFTIPLAFVAHRRFTFASTGSAGSELGRFVLVHAAGMLVSWVAMAVAADGLGLGYIPGIIAATVLVPLISFFVFDRFVFRSARHGPRR